MDCNADAMYGMLFEAWL